MAKKTKVIMIAAIIVVLVAGIVLLLTLGNVKDVEDVTVEDTVAVNVVEDTELPEVGEINYNDTEEGQAEIKRLGFEGRDDVQVRPDVVSITEEEIAERIKSIRETPADYTYDASILWDDTQEAGGMSWLRSVDGAAYTVATSIIMQYATDLSIDPYAFTCDIGDEYEYIDGISTMYFHNETTILGIVYEYTMVNHEFVGYLKSVEEIQ